MVGTRTRVSGLAPLAFRPTPSPRISRSKPVRACVAASTAGWRASLKEEEASFESALRRAVPLVIESAPSEHLPFKDVRKAVAARLREISPHFGKEIDIIDDIHGASNHSAVQTLTRTLRAHRFVVLECGVRDVRFCEQLPAVAGAAPSSPRTAPVSPRASPRGDGVSFPPVNPPVNRADRSRSRDEEPKQPQRSRRAPKPA